MIEPWLTKAAAARFWGCSERTIEYAMKDGLPHATIFGRPKFRPSECEPWLEQNGLLVRSGGCTVGADEANGAATADTAPPHDQGGNP